MKSKERQIRESPKSITIKLSVGLKRQIDTLRKLTGETLSQIIERGIAQLLESNQKRSRYHAEQGVLAQQLHDIANDLRQIVQKIDKVAPERASDGSEALNVMVVGKKPAWHSHPHKEKIFQMIRDMHRVGANLNMIATALNLEGLQNIAGNGEWKVPDVQKIVSEIKKERDYLPPLYSLPE